MKKTTKTLALVLACLFAASSVWSCGKKEDKKDNASTVSPEKIEENQLEVPKGIAEGKTFSMYIANPDIKNSFIAEEATGADLVDAVYQ